MRNLIISVTESVETASESHFVEWCVVLSTAALVFVSVLLCIVTWINVQTEREIHHIEKDTHDMDKQMRKQTRLLRRIANAVAPKTPIDCKHRKN